MADLQIAEVARKFGISLRTLRFYEEEGILHPKRVGRMRFYSDREDVRLQLIARGKLLGFSLSEIKEMISLRKISVETGEFSLERNEISTKLERLIAQRDEINNAIVELEMRLDHMNQSDDCDAPRSNAM